MVAVLKSLLFSFNTMHEMKFTSQNLNQKHTTLVYVATLRFAALELVIK